MKLIAHCMFHCLKSLGTLCVSVHIATFLTGGHISINRPLWWANNVLSGTLEIRNSVPVRSSSFYVRSCGGISSFYVIRRPRAGCSQW